MSKTNNYTEVIVFVQILFATTIVYGKLSKVVGGYRAL